MFLNAFPMTAGLKGSEDQKRLAVHYTALQHYQENVFIEGSRPQYLEDLHTEAQEGLKILQQEGQTSNYTTLTNRCAIINLFSFSFSFARTQEWTELP